MPTLYETLLPHLQAINEEGGNFSTFLLWETILDAIDAGTAEDRELTRIKVKILEKIAAYGGKRDHLGFNQIFEAYSEGVVYLAATQRRGLRLRTLADGAKQGKTPDLATVSDLPVGLEVKTINVVDPARTIDQAMDQGFETSYAALEASRAEVKKKGTGVGFGEMSFAPHGAGTDQKDAIEQTIRKIGNNIKAGQFEARPTLLVVSLARLGVCQRAADLRRRLEVDEDCGDAPSGHLFAIAARNLDDPHFDYSHRWYGVRDAGPLDVAGVLRDHDQIAGLVFLQTIWNKDSEPDALQTGFRFNGMWNAGWDPTGRFTPEQKAEAHRVFEQLCDTWNDTEDSRAHLIPDRRALAATFQHRVGKFVLAWRDRLPDDPTLSAFMIEADRDYFRWQAALAEVTDAACYYTAPLAEDVRVGRLESDDAPVIFLSCAPDLIEIPRLRLVKRGPRWQPEEDAGPVRPCEIVL